MVIFYGVVYISRSFDHGHYDMSDSSKNAFIMNDARIKPRFMTMPYKNGKPYRVVLSLLYAVFTC